MYFSPSQRVFLQIVTVITLMAFFPSSVGAWNFLPQDLVRKVNEIKKETRSNGTEGAVETARDVGVLLPDLGNGEDEGAPPADPHPDSCRADLVPSADVALPEPKPALERAQVVLAKRLEHNETSGVRFAAFSDESQENAQDPGSLSEMSVRAMECQGASEERVALLMELVDRYRIHLHGQWPAQHGPRAR